MRHDINHALHPRRIDRLCRFKVKNARDSAHGNVL
jgi:hypothetical protein